MAIYIKENGVVTYENQNEEARELFPNDINVEQVKKMIEDFSNLIKTATVTNERGNFEFIKINNLCFLFSTANIGRKAYTGYESYILCEAPTGFTPKNTLNIYAPTDNESAALRIIANNEGKIVAYNFGSAVTCAIMSFFICYEVE